MKKRPRHIGTRDVYISAGVALGAVLVGMADLLPWAGLALWVLACGLFLRVIVRAIPWHPVLRIGMAVASAALALSLWRATSARADIRVVELVPVQEGVDRAGSFELNIVFENAGQWAAEAKAVSRIGLFETVPAEDVKRRAALEEHVRMGLGDVPDASALAFQLAPNQRHYSTVSGELSAAQASALSEGRLTAYIASEIRYRDWWIMERGTRVCAFTSGSMQVIVQCVRYTQSW